MEHKLLNKLACIKSADIGTTVLSDPVNSSRSQENDDVIIRGALDHLVNAANVLISVSNGGTLFSH